MAQLFEGVFINQLLGGFGAPVRTAVTAATTVNGTISTAYAAGQAIDGVTLALDDRILLKDQTSATENGIYIVTAGTPLRSADYDEGDSGSTVQVYVKEGTANAQTTWICNSAPGADVVGTNNLTFEQATGRINGLTPGSFTSANITVDAQGRITAAANGGGGAPSTAQYLVLATDAALDNERVFDPVADLAVVDNGAGGNYSVQLSTTGVVADTYRLLGDVTIDSKGRISAAAQASPASTTDRSIAIWNGTGANGLLDTGVTIDASNNITGVNDLTATSITTLTINGNPTLTVNGDTTFTNNVIVDGDLTVNGTTTTINSVNLNVDDNCILLNSSYTTAVALDGCIVANYLPTATNDTSTAVSGFTAGVAATSNPTVSTTGAATFSAGDLVLITGATDASNNGLFEVDTHATNVLTIRGVGTVGTTVGFVQNQFVTDAADNGATITLVNVSVISSGTDGFWETERGSTTVGWAPIKLVETIADAAASTGVSLIGGNAGDADGPELGLRTLVGGTGITVAQSGAGDVTITADATSLGVNYDIFPGQAVATGTTFVRIADFTWDDSQYSAYNTGTLTFHVTVGGTRTLNVRLRNVTAGADVVSTTVGATGFQRVTGLTNPVADAQLELQISYNAGTSPSPRISGVQLAWENTA